jgi:catechol 2,3-dioxygenase-like lactoylglutathione lyase family enzyme
MKKSGIKKLHHAAYRCKDSEETRAFYEDFLGLRFVEAFEINMTKTGRDSKVLHSFYALDNDACIAFFEEPDEPFDFKKQRDFDLHIAFEVDKETLEPMLEKGKKLGMETRGISDHGNFHSIYFRDPNGYVIELAANVDDDKADDPKAVLKNWQETKPPSVS